MFVQIVHGAVKDPDQVRQVLDRWADELARTGVGLLGATGGVSDDGRFVNVARFESEEAARANDADPKQSQWWAELAQWFDGTPTFHESHDVLQDIVGDPDQAGFVQVIQARSSDPSLAKELMTSNAEEWAALRPDVLGSLMVFLDEGLWTTVVWFTSEADAREGEQKPLPPELTEQVQAMDGLGNGDADFFDLRDPWLFTPG